MLRSTEMSPGCLLLGVGPTPDGIIEDEVTKRLHEIGQWLKINGKAIYATRTTPNNKQPPLAVISIKILIIFCDDLKGGWITGRYSLGQNIVKSTQETPGTHFGRPQHT